MTDAEIVSIYPELFQDILREGREFTLPVGDGWYPIVAKLVREIKEVDEELGVQSRVVQIKEKFGALRFYLDKPQSAHCEMIARAENESTRTCEDCGAPGKMYNDGWVLTLCREHALDRWQNRFPWKKEIPWETCWPHDIVNNSETGGKN